MSLIDSLGWSAFAPSWTAGSELIPARVSSQQRGLHTIGTDLGTFTAMLRGNLLDDPPVVGDWVAVRILGDPQAPDTRALIEQRLPRHTVLARRRVGGGPPQIVAANVDCVAVVTSADSDFNPRRNERYLAVARGAGCEARVVVSKADVVDDITAFVDALTEPPIVVSAHTGMGLDTLQAWVGGRTVALLGSSGVGKSSLINALLGTEVRAVGDVREGDGRGRHTTTTRDLLVLPDAIGGGCVIDTPGMREIGLAGSADPDQVFAEIAELSTRCLYRDCSHTQEGGCAVLDAVERGEIEPGRLASYHKLGRELAHERRREDKRAMSAERRRWAQMVKQTKRLKKERGY